MRISTNLFRQIIWQSCQRRSQIKPRVRVRVGVGVGVRVRVNLGPPLTALPIIFLKP